MRTFITSDIHLFDRGHVRDTWHMDVVDHAHWVLGQWRLQIDPEDTVYLLGDIGNAEDPRTADVLRQLPGRIFAIPSVEKDDYELIERCRNLYPLPPIYMIDGDKSGWYGIPDITLSHYPLMRWPGDRHGGIHFHGHLHGHGTYPKGHRIYDVILTRSGMIHNMDNLVAMLRGVREVRHF